MAVYLRFTLGSRPLRAFPLLVKSKLIIIFMMRLFSRSMGAIVRSTSNRLARGIPFFEKTKQGPVHLETIAGAQKNRIVRCSTAYSPSKRGGGRAAGRLCMPCSFSIVVLSLVEISWGAPTLIFHIRFQSLKDVVCTPGRTRHQKLFYFP
jgi:hypothetical protein